MAEYTESSCLVRPLNRAEKRAEYERDAAKAPDVRKGIRDELLRIGHHYFIDEISVAEMEESLKDAWDELIHAARIIPSDSSEHDRLVTLVLELREFGPLTRSKKDTLFEDERESAVVPNGQRLWADVPYLAQELQSSWGQESIGFGDVERQNLATLTAKLCASGVCSHDIADCALWLFREALETERPLDTESGEGQAAGSVGPTIAQLLPACLAWLDHGSFKLAKLCAGGHSSMSMTSASGDDQRLLISPGPLAVKSNIPPKDYSMERWLFWRRRLGELYISGNEAVAPIARKCFEIMVSSGLPMGVDIPGEKRYLERVFEALDKELVARDFKESIASEDIRIDPRWADDD
ncbi:hypothetical protein HIM_02941 [Hirsutella minnesotensis 3608]|nr:hypothetical protein HIM_02941 [Hirsutella minnesotensis 3608]